MSLKLVHEGDDHFLFAHPEGHQVTVAKKNLSKGMQDQIKQKFASGGEVNYGTTTTNTIDQDKAKAFTASLNGQQPKPDTQPQPKPQKLYAGGDVLDKFGNVIPKDPTLLASNNVPATDQPAQRDSSAELQAKHIEENSKNVVSKPSPVNTLAGPSATTLSDVWNSISPSNITYKDANAEDLAKYGSADAAELAYRNQQAQRPIANLPVKSQSQSPSLVPPPPDNSGILGDMKAADYKPVANTTTQPTAPQPAQHIEDPYAPIIKNIQNLNNQYQQSYDAVKSGSVDPMRIFHNMSTGQHISTAIGLILGGFSSMAGQSNPVMDSINKAIDRDVEAQKADIGKNTTLLDATLKQYGNMDVAANVVKLHNLAAVEGMLDSKDLAKMGPVAQMQAQIFKQKLGQQIQQLSFQTGIQQQAFGSGASSMVTSSPGGTNKGNVQNIGYTKTAQESQNPYTPQAQFTRASQQVEFGGMPEETKKVARNEIKTVQELHSLRGDLLHEFDSIANMPLNGTFSPSNYESARKAFLPKLVTLLEHRYNYESAQQTADALFPRKLSYTHLPDWSDTIKDKRDRMVREFDSLSQTPVLDAWQIQLPKQTSDTKPPLASAGEVQKAGYNP